MSDTKCCEQCGRELPKPREVEVEVELVFRTTRTVKVVAATPAEAERLAKVQAKKIAEGIAGDCEPYGIEEHSVESCTADGDDFDPPPRKR